MTKKARKNDEETLTDMKNAAAVDNSQSNITRLFKKRQKNEYHQNN